MLRLSQPFTPAASAESNKPSGSEHGPPSGLESAATDLGLRRSPRRPAAGCPTTDGSPGGDDSDDDLEQLDDNSRDLLMTPHVCALLDGASPLTKAVDNYMLQRIGHTQLFFDIYLAHGIRSIEVADGPRLTAYKCLCGCIPRKDQVWYPISPKQNSQAVYDHVFSQKHIANCKPDCCNTEDDLRKYIARTRKIAPRTDRWGRDGNKESRSRNTKPRNTARKAAKQSQPPEKDSTVIALFQNTESIANYCLNSQGPPGLVNSQGLQAGLTQQVMKRSTRTH